MVSENHTEVPEHLETILMQLARNSIYAANPFFEIKAYPSLCIKVMCMAFILLTQVSTYLQGFITSQRTTRITKIELQQ
jgi:hypothetical protein